MDMKKCPACGTVLEADVDRCPSCSLDGLNQIFLSREAYEAWYHAVVEPHTTSLPPRDVAGDETDPIQQRTESHAASQTPRVFAGDEYGLILTAAGDLYGVGKNSFQQISKEDTYFINQPCLIARDVVSAAAGERSTIYVTRDGEVHLLGEYARWFTGFSDAKEVYADRCFGRFWIIRRDGKVFAFGYNLYERLEKDRVILEKKLPILKSKQTLLRLGKTWLPSHYWSDGKRWTANVEDKVKMSEDYKALAEKYIPHTLDIVPNPIGNDSSGNTHYEPIIRVTNRYILQPIPHHPDWISDLRHQCGCRPFFQQEYTPEIAQVPGIKKVSGFMSSIVFPGSWTLYLQADGTVLESNGEQFEVPNQPVADLSLGSEILMMSCQNGDVFWYTSRDHIRAGGTRIPADLLREHEKRISGG